MSKKRRDPKATREALLRAAIAEFESRGYFSTDSNRIAKAAGVSPGSFYRYFGDKRTIFLELYEGWVTKEWLEIDAALAQGPPEPEALVAFVLEHHRRWKEMRAALRVLVASDEVVRQAHRESRERQLERLAELMERLGRPQADREADAMLLFTFERVCDAIATGEASALGLRESWLREELVAALGRHLGSATTG